MQLKPFSHLHTRTHTHARTHARTHTHTHTHTNNQPTNHTYIHTLILTCAHTHTHTFIGHGRMACDAPYTPAKMVLLVMYLTALNSSCSGNIVGVCLVQRSFYLYCLTFIISALLGLLLLEVLPCWTILLLLVSASTCSFAFASTTRAGTRNREILVAYSHYTCRSLVSMPPQL